MESAYAACDIKRFDMRDIHGFSRAVGTDGVFQHGAVVCSEKHAPRWGGSARRRGNAVDALRLGSGHGLLLILRQEISWRGLRSSIGRFTEGLLSRFSRDSSRRRTARYFWIPRNVDRDRALAGVGRRNAGRCRIMRMHSRFGRRVGGNSATGTSSCRQRFEVSERCRRISSNMIPCCAVFPHRSCSLL